jgi:hypothetical protein
MDNQVKKDALEAQVKAFFESRKDVEVVYGTVDGNLFTKKRLNDAKNHAKANGLELFEYERANTQKAGSDGGEVGEKEIEAASEITPENAKAAPKKAAGKK